MKNYKSLKEFINFKASFKWFNTCLLLFVTLTPILAQSQTQWQLRKNEDGIKVFSGNAENSEFKMIKVECTLDATPATLIALLKDIDKKHEWVYSSKESEVLKINNPADFIFYAQVAVPWPFLDRDYIAHMTINQVSNDFVTIDVKSEPNKLPAKQGIIRVVNHGAHWDINDLGNGKSKVIYTVSFNPGGAIPAWLSNLFVVKAPFETFQTIRNKVQQPKYRNASFDFKRA